AAFASKNRYHAAHYAVRQSFLHDGISLNSHEMHRHRKDHKAYQALPATVAQWVLRLLDKNWQSCCAARAAWQEAPSQFLGRPKLLGYQDQHHGRTVLIYTLQARSAPALRKGVIRPSMVNLTVQTRQHHVQPVRIVPRSGFYVVEV